MPGAVHARDDSTLELTYTMPIIMALVNAVQELAAEVERLGR